MIDIKELRQLVQAATPGPWYVTGKLTRYVEARIDGGLIQEVAACGPTKADGGYGPQQEANARLIAAANPAAISELLDRLKAAEKERDALRADKATLQQMMYSLKDRLEVAEKERDWHAERCEDAMNECDALRAKTAEMEQQEPVAWMHETRRDSDVVTDAVKHVWGKVAVGSMAAYSIPLYTLPGAKGEEK